MRISERKVTPERVAEVAALTGLIYGYKGHVLIRNREKRTPDFHYGFDVEARLCADTMEPLTSAEVGRRIREFEHEQSSLTPLNGFNNVEVWVGLNPPRQKLPRDLNAGGRHAHS